MKQNYDEILSFQRDDTHKNLKEMLILRKWMCTYICADRKRGMLSMC